MIKYIYCDEIPKYTIKETLIDFFILGGLAAVAVVTYWIAVHGI